MEIRWLILLVLFIVRTVMGLQFQSVASVSPFFMTDLGIDYTGLGLLIGIFHLPGFILAFPGGLLGKRCGDKPVVISGLALMTIGGLIMGASDSYALSVSCFLPQSIGSGRKTSRRIDKGQILAPGNFSGTHSQTRLGAI